MIEQAILTPATRKCTHCGGLFAVEPGSQQRTHDECEAVLIARRQKPRPRGERCLCCNGSGTVVLAPEETQAGYAATVYGLVEPSVEQPTKVKRSK